jgi:hypothetical protein
MLAVEQGEQGVVVELQRDAALLARGGRAGAGFEGEGVAQAAFIS